MRHKYWEYFIGKIHVLYSFKLGGANMSSEVLVSYKGIGYCNFFY